MKQSQKVFKIVFSSIMLTLSYVLPFLTGQIPEIGSMLCPMHIPVILCGFICGWKYGLIVGIVSPLLRSLTLGMPPLFPTAFAMSFELATYGFLAGYLYNILSKNKINIYITLLLSMLIGRLVWGITMIFLVGFNVEKFGLSTFIAAGFINALPGIILQIIIIPFIIMIYEKSLKKY